MLPHYLSIGLTYHEFMHSTPKVLKAYDKAHMKKIELIDSLAWQFCGNYMLSAVAVAVEHCLAGRKAKSEYVKQAVLKDFAETKDLTEEEKKQRKIDEFVAKLNAMKESYDSLKKQGQ